MALACQHLGITRTRTEVFNVTLADVPARKQDLMASRYELPAPPAGVAVAVKVIDMLGEERIVVPRA